LFLLGHDLLESLTSTFDQKMKSLMGQEQVDASAKQENEDGQTSAEIDFRPYRDPSLHRSKTRMNEQNGSPQVNIKHK